MRKVEEVLTSGDQAQDAESRGFDDDDGNARKLAPKIRASALLGRAMDNSKTVPVLPRSFRVFTILEGLSARWHEVIDRLRLGRILEAGSGVNTG